MQYAKSRCVEIYGKEPAHSYVFGGSGGGVRSTGLIERFPKVYDGAAPVVGAGDVLYFVYLQSMFEMYRAALEAKARRISDAVRIPGQGDPFTVLETSAEREALRMVLATGYPLNSFWLIRPLAVGVTVFDFFKYKVYPEYFDEFWEQSAYAESAALVKAQAVDGIAGVVKSVNQEKRILVTDVTRRDLELYGYTLVLHSGPLKGQWRRVLANQGASLMVGSVGPGVEQVSPGDRFTLDNRDLLAWRALHRHIADDPQDQAMRHLFDKGKPKYPLIPKEKIKEAVEAGRNIGKFAGKMIMVFGTDDPLMWPTVAARYQRRVQEAWGGQADQHYRLHFLEHGVHGAPLPSALHRQVPNRAIVYKALDDLMAWVERGAAPAAGTTYSVGEHSQLVLPETARERRGYQPVVSLAVEQQGGDAEITVTAEDPDNDIIVVELDREGDGKFDEQRKVQGRSVREEFKHHYSSGTFYPAARVMDATSGPGRTGPGIQNVASAMLRVP